MSQLSYLRPPHLAGTIQGMLLSGSLDQLPSPPSGQQAWHYIGLANIHIYIYTEYRKIHEPAHDFPIQRGDLSAIAMFCFKHNPYYLLVIKSWQ